MTMLFGKLSGTASGGTIESILNQLSSEPIKDQKAAADPYCLNPAGNRYALQDHMFQHGSFIHSFIYTCARQAQQAQLGTYRSNQLSPTSSVMC